MWRLRVQFSFPRRLLRRDLHSSIYGILPNLKFSAGTLSLSSLSSFSQISEMENVFERMATDSKRSLENTTSLLHERTNDLSSCRMENEQLKVLLLSLLLLSSSSLSLSSSSLSLLLYSVAEV